MDLPAPLPTGRYPGLAESVRFGPKLPILYSGLTLEFQSYLDNRIEGGRGTLITPVQDCSSEPITSYGDLMSRMRSTPIPLNVSVEAERLIKR